MVHRRHASLQNNVSTYSTAIHEGIAHTHSMGREHTVHSLFPASVLPAYLRFTTAIMTFSRAVVNQGYSGHSLSLRCAWYLAWRFHNRGFR